MSSKGISFNMLSSLFGGLSFNKKNATPKKSFKAKVSKDNKDSSATSQLDFEILRRRLAGSISNSEYNLGELGRLLSGHQHSLLVSHLQPQYLINETSHNHKQAKVYGFESLARIECYDHHHKDNINVMTPDAFMEKATAIKHINEMDCLLMLSTLKKVNKFFINAQNAKLSFNFDSQFFQDTDTFIPKIKKILDDTLFEGHIVIEVTEKGVIEYFKTNKTITALHDMNIEVALDDFGTGEPRMISQLDIDCIKIDRSLLKNIAEERHQNYLSGILQICNKMEIEIVIEGCSTCEEFQVLQKIGFSRYQGFLFDKAMPIETIRF